MAEKRVFKKKSNLAGGTTLYRKWGEWSEGDMIVMRFLEAKPDNYGKFTYIGDVLDCNFDDASKYLNKRMGLNSSGALISAMKKIQPEMIFQLTYHGKDKLTSGQHKGSDFHNMEIDLVEEGEDGNNDGEDFNDDEEAFF